MTSVTLSCGVKIRVEQGMLVEVYIFCHDLCHTFRWYGNEGRERNAWGSIYVVMTSVIVSGGVKRRDEHGMPRGVHIYFYDFCYTFRWFENERRAWNV